MRRVSGRTSYTSEDEHEAEVMAGVIRQLMERGSEVLRPRHPPLPGRSAGPAEAEIALRSLVTPFPDTGLAVSAESLAWRRTRLPLGPVPSTACP
ncbi:hypothetical protein SBADM41S_09242 [Streptomyces badius]